MESFNLILKHATEASHRSVEATAISRLVMSPALTLEGYAEYLYKSYLVQHAVETSAFPVLNTIVSDVNSRIKTPFILDDLMQLGKKHTPGEALLLDSNYRHTPAFNLGLMYVSEGSVLGGQYILKHVKKTLGEQTPCSFLNVYGERTGSTWKNFVEALNAYAGNASEPEKQEIIEGAMYGFKRVEFIFNLPYPTGIKIEQND